MNWLESPQKALTLAAIGVFVGFALIAIGLNLLTLIVG